MRNILGKSDSQQNLKTLNNEFKQVLENRFIEVNLDSNNTILRDLKNNTRNFINPFDKRLTTFSTFKNSTDKKKNERIKTIITDSIYKPKMPMYKKIMKNSISSPNLLNKETLLFKSEYNTLKSTNNNFSIPFSINGNRLENLKSDYINDKKKKFLNRQRQYYLKHSEYTTRHILAPNYSQGKNIENDEKDDIYNHINDLSNELEYVKKYIIPPIPKSEVKQSSELKKEIFRRKLSLVRKISLNELLPGANLLSEDINKGYSIKIHKKGMDYVYEIVKETSRKEQKINIPSLSVGRQKKNLETVINNLDKLKMQSPSRLNELPLITNSRYKMLNKLKSNYYTKIKEEQLNNSIKLEISKLKNIKKTIQVTLDNAVNNLCQRENI